MAELPAITTMGMYEVGHAMKRLDAELASGAAVHLVDKRTRRHRAWVVPSCDPGYEVERISRETFAKHLGLVLDTVRDRGVAVEVTFRRGRGGRREGEVAFYVTWCPPEALAREPAALQWHTRNRLGQLLLREFPDASAVEAVRG